MLKSLLMRTMDVVLVGAGPIGIELAVALKRAGVDYVQFEKRQIGQTIFWFPPQTRFFSSNDRIGIAGVPLQTVDQSKATREEYLAYLRSVVLQFDLDVRTYEKVKSVQPGDGGFTLVTQWSGGERTWRAGRVILTTGGLDRPRLLGIPGEDGRHVSHFFHEPHVYFRRRVLVVGGKNSAVAAALRCFHVGAQVAMSYRREKFEPGAVKYWLLPELLGRIDRKEIACYYETVPAAIGPDHAVLQPVKGGAAFEVPADFVLLMTGFVADLSLYERAGVRLDPRTGVPAFDPRTMETNVPGLFVAGTAVGGTQDRFEIFIENTHVHVERIMAALAGRPPPGKARELLQPET